METDGLSLSRISRRVLEARPRFPAASATRAVKEWVRLVARLDVGVKDQLRPLTEALPRKAVAGIDAECVSGAEVAVKKDAREGGSAVVGASAIGEDSLDEPDVVGDACDGAAWREQRNPGSVVVCWRLDRGFQQHQQRVL